ncbi:hypothetical protein BU25DRAFT_423112 [Macroventuria anomochaeta]|uniref:Uncharacterized protein n=1 Tax=Macroventuria anomochaeta TaxID=301207 RepID=A0ACB6RXB5_9PLEO|nr:uncharacterized protein BU25DRAFT_423112 [Macroventuria anomochaeta]KAF2625784.1 hypothetical protein BU25DRAFT_423112 [Macroventuria anomochaeta]
MYNTKSSCKAFCCDVSLTTTDRKVKIVPGIQYYLDGDRSPNNGPIVIASRLRKEVELDVSTQLSGGACMNTSRHYESSEIASISTLARTPGQPQETARVRNSKTNNNTSTLPPNRYGIIGTANAPHEATTFGDHPRARAARNAPARRQHQSMTRAMGFSPFPSRSGEGADSQCLEEETA